MGPAQRDTNILSENFPQLPETAVYENETMAVACGCGRFQGGTITYRGRKVGTCEMMEVHAEYYAQRNEGQKEFNCTSLVGAKISKQYLIACLIMFCGIQHSTIRVVCSPYLCGFNDYCRIGHNISLMADDGRLRQTALAKYRLALSAR